MATDIDMDVQCPRKKSPVTKKNARLFRSILSYDPKVFVFFSQNILCSFVCFARSRKKKMGKCELKGFFCIMKVVNFLT
jgi:hypothetical protein